MSGSEFDFHEIMWATLSPDVYAGPNCDGVKHRWKCFTDGDRGSEYITEPLELDPEHFHPGTRVLVLEPRCPQCSQIASMCRDDSSCDYDWDSWILGEFS